MLNKSYVMHLSSNRLQSDKYIDTIWYLAIRESYEYRHTALPVRL